MTSQARKREHSLVSPILALATGLGLCALLLPFIFAYGFIYPQGDDFDEATRAVCLFDFLGAVYEVFREWFTWSGRYAYHFMAVFFGKAAESRFWAGLVCFGVLCSYAFAFWWLISPLVSNRFYSRLHALVLSLGALVALYASYGSLPNFYLLTDALTIAHQGATALFFLALVILLWQKVFRVAGSCKKEWKRALLTGIFAIGVYEHAALAVICISLTTFGLACLLHKLGYHLPMLENIHFRHMQPKGKWNQKFSHFLGKLNTPLIRPFLTLLLCLMLPLAFSFLAPGNFMRNASRGIDLATQLAQLKLVWTDWLAAMVAFLESPWIPLLLCLVMAMRFFERPEGPAKGHLSLLAGAASVVCFLVFSFSLVFMHALTDVPMHGSQKLAASFGFYAAITFAVLLFNALAHLRLPARLPRLARSLLAMCCMAIFGWLVFNTHNFQATFINAVNGNFGVLAAEMASRNQWLEDLRNENAIQPDPKGLLGEILFSGTRQRKVRPDLPLAVVDKAAQSVFPVYMREALADNCESWPNLWAAWMYGQGCVYAKDPDDSQALLLAAASKGLELAIPESLRAAGLENAWRVDASGGPGPTFALSWLVLQFSRPNIAPIYALRCNPPMRPRLAPLDAQYLWLENLQKESETSLTFSAELAATVLSFGARTDGALIRAYPMGQAPMFNVKFPAKIFISLNGRDFFALQYGKEKRAAQQERD